MIGIPMVAAFAVALMAAAPAQDLAPLAVDAKAGTVSFGAKAAKQDVYEQLKGTVEYLIVMPGGKEYESLFIAPLDPLKLHAGMIQAGLKPGKASEEGDDGKRRPPEGAKLKITVEWGEGDQKRREPAEAFVRDVVAKKNLEAPGWTFSGSREGFDPVTEKTVLQVVSTKNLVALFHNDATVLVQPTLVAKDPHQFKANKELLPKAGTPVRVIIEAAR